MDKDFIHEWWYRWYKGKLQSHVARGKEAQSKILKTLRTGIQRGSLSSDEVKQLLAEVEAESVRPFTDSARHERLRSLRDQIQVILSERWG